MENSQGTAPDPIKADFEKSPQSDHRLEQQLSQQPYDYGFFQALRRLECLFKENPRLGTALKCQQEPIRIGQNPSLAFAPSSLASYKQGEPGRAPRLQVNFFGLLGPNGPMPLHMTEYTYERLHHFGDFTLSRFLDIFHHRMLSLFYRAWADAQPTVSYDRPDSDRFSDYLATLMGIGLPGLRNRTTLPDRSKIFFAGHFAQQNGNAEGLRHILSEYLQLPVVIEEFVGKWITIPEEFRFVLGDSAETASLGQTMLLGAESWSVEEGIRIVIGPVNLADFQRLQPGGRSLACLSDIVRQYIGDQLQWDVQVILNKQFLPPFELSYYGELGRSLWLYSETPQDDVADLIIEPEEMIPA